jgi:hypothetical protein
MFESSRPELRVLAIPILRCRGSNPAAPTGQSVSNAYGSGSRSKCRIMAPFRQKDLVSACADCNDPAHHPAVKPRPILTLRPPELSGRNAEHLTEVTRQVALVGKPHGKRNLR